MASWGLLKGLGEGLTNFGTDMSKRAMADKLEAEREARAEQREIDRETRAEARKAKVVASTELVPRDGSYVKQYKNHLGEVIREEAANPDEIEKIGRQKKKEDLDLRGMESLLTGRDLDVQLKTKQLGTFDEDRALDLQEQRSRIRENEAQAAAAGRRGSGSSGGGGLEGSLAGSVAQSDVARALLDQEEGFVKQYMYDEEKNPEGLQYDEMYELARRSLDSARKQGKDPVDVFRRALPGFKARLRAGNKD